MFVKVTSGVMLTLTVLLAGGGTAAAARDTKWMKNTEVFMTEDDFQRLDPFEAQRLDEADRAFEDKQWRQARAAYDAFMLEFPKSHVIPYALMRKGRAIQRDNKADEAIQTYNEVMDYFPNSVAYAAPTLFYMGECRASQQKWTAAMDLWKEMAEDVDYSKHPFAAAAINRLADGLYAQGKYADAGKFYLKSLTSFRRGDDGEVGHSISQILRIWVRDKPDVTALREACKAASGFEIRPDGKLAEDDQHFWDTVRAKIREHGRRFEAEQKSERKAYYEYWTGVMKGQMPRDDDFQKDLADFHLVLDGKRDKWYARLDKQFEAYQKAGDNDRIAKWMLFYTYDQQKLEEYFRKFDAASTRNEMLVPLILALFRVKEARPMSYLVFKQLKFAALPDSARVKELSKGNLASDLARSYEEGGGALFRESHPYVMQLYRMYGNQDLAYWDELGYWHYRAQRYDPGAAEKGIPMADKCAKNPKYAKDAYRMKAEMLLTLGRIDEAIAAYRATDDLPGILFTIATLLVKQGKHAAAVSELSQVEGSGAFPREAPKAALEIANIWKGAGQKQLYVGALTTLIAKYPNTRESSSAHNALESMGLSHLIRGGRDAD